MGCIRRFSRTVLTALAVIFLVILVASFASPKRPNPPADNSAPTAALSAPELAAATATTAISVQSVEIPTSTSAPTVIASATITDTPPVVPPTSAPTTAPTSVPAAADGVVAISPVTYYAGANGANLRSCANRECERVASVAAGAALVVDGTMQGETVSGSTLWYHVAYGDQDAYVHSSILETAATVVQAGQPVQSVQAQPIAPVAGQTWNCAGDLYNCNDAVFTNYSTIMSYFHACPGDPSKLDNPDNDGVPCEARVGD